MDGWSDKVKEITEEVLEKAYAVRYEMDTSIKGSETDCKTTSELAEYFRDIAKEFNDVADELEELEEDEDEEVDESYRPRRRRFLNED